MLIGLIGKPSVGKSTFFKAATLSDVQIASYPFTTIKPNHGIGYVKVDCIDKEFGPDIQCQPNHGFCVSHKRFVPVELMDVAGLVPGASEGKGLGNRFLDDLRQADVFIHIIDVSGTTNAEGKATEGYDPSYDIEFLEDELNKWYNDIFMKIWGSFARKTEVGNISFSEVAANQFSGLKVNEEQIKKVLRKANLSGKPSAWSEKQIKKFTSELRKESKPMIIAANKVDTEKGRENYEKLVKQFPSLIIIPCSADFELALKEAAKANLIVYIPGEKNFKILDENRVTEKQKQALDKIKERVLDVFEYGTGVQAILNHAVFSLLKYIAVYPVNNSNKLTDSKGKVLPDCFLLPGGSTALDFAYYLHTQLGQGFIRAIDARTKRILGRDHTLNHSDVLEIVIK